MQRAEARKPRPDKRRARGRIEHTLLVGGWLHLNRPKTFAHSPLNPTIPQKSSSKPLVTDTNSREHPTSGLLRTPLLRTGPGISKLPVTPIRRSTCPVTTAEQHISNSDPLAEAGDPLHPGQG